MKHAKLKTKFLDCSFQEKHPITDDLALLWIKGVKKNGHVQHLNCYSFPKHVDEHKHVRQNEIYFGLYLNGLFAQLGQQIES